MELLDFAKTDTAARLRAAAKRGALSHALIFSGSGDRVSAARYAAAAMECTAESKPCLACPACRKVMQDIHPDVTFVRDAEHKELSIDTVRAMRADAFIRPNEGAQGLHFRGLHHPDGKGPERAFEARGGGTRLRSVLLLRGKSGGSAPDHPLALRGGQALPHR